MNSLALLSDKMIACRPYWGSKRKKKWTETKENEFFFRMNGLRALTRMFYRFASKKKNERKILWTCFRMGRTMLRALSIYFCRKNRFLTLNIDLPSSSLDRYINHWRKLFQKIIFIFTSKWKKEKFTCLFILFFLVSIRKPTNFQFKILKGK